MIVVLGLITIMLGLALGLTVKVYNGIKSGGTTQQNAQAWIMMQAARKLLQVHAATIPPGGITIGDLQGGDLPSKELDDRLGWARIRPNGGSFNVIACGGASGSGGKNLFTDGTDIRNAMDVRYYYVMSPAGSVTLQPAQTNHYADRW